MQPFFSQLVLNRTKDNNFKEKADQRNFRQRSRRRKTQLLTLIGISGWTKSLQIIFLYKKSVVTSQNFAPIWLPHWPTFERKDIQKLENILKPKIILKTQHIQTQLVKFCNFCNTWRWMISRIVRQEGYYGGWWLTTNCIARFEFKKSKSVCASR